MPGIAHGAAQLLQPVIAPYFRLYLAFTDPIPAVLLAKSSAPGNTIGIKISLIRSNISRSAIRAAHVNW